MSFKSHNQKANQAVENRSKPIYAKRLPTCSVNFMHRKKSVVISFKVRCCGKISNSKSTGIRAERGQFNTATLEVAGDPLATARLYEIRSSIIRTFNERVITGRSLDPTLIRDIALGLQNHDVDRPTVIMAVNRYVNLKAKLLGNGIGQRTLRRYEAYAATIAEYITENFGVDSSIDELKPAIGSELLVHLKGIKKLGHNYAIKHIQLLKSALDYAMANEWCNRNVLVGYRFRKEYKPVRVLTLKELDKIRQTSFEEESIELVKDGFLFCCYTGLAYADLSTITTGHLIEVEGVLCIMKTRQKSGQQSFVPLFPEALALIEKYKSHPGCRLNKGLLPVLTNAAMNRLLKIIGSTAGIKESLHSHLARKTFTRYAEDRGFNLTEMATMMGHSKTYMTEKHYYQSRQDTVLRTFKSIHRTDELGESRMTG